MAPGWRVGRGVEVLMDLRTLNSVLVECLVSPPLMPLIQLLKYRERLCDRWTKDNFDQPTIAAGFFTIFESP